MSPCVARFLFLPVVVSFVYSVSSASEKILLPMRLGLIPGFSGVFQTCESLVHCLDSDTGRAISEESEVHLRLL